MSFCRSFLPGLRFVALSIVPWRQPVARPTVCSLLCLMAFAPPFLLLQLVHWFALALDELLFPAYRRTAVRRPLFIVGVPRSGTTFLHRLVAREPSFTTFSLWELLLAPALCEKYFWRLLARGDQWLGGIGARVVRGVSGGAMQRLAHIHAIDWQSPEEDYLSLLPVWGCFLLVLPFPVEGVWRLAFFDRDATPLEKQRLLSFYRGIVQRHLWFHGPEKRFLSKNPSFSPLVECLLAEFPDARFMACVRSPLQTVPSLLSSMERGWRLFGHRHSDADFQRRLMATLHYNYLHLADVAASVCSSRWAFVDFQELIEQPGAVVLSTLARLGFDAAGSFTDTVDAVGRQEGDGQRPHRYTLEQFQLTPAMLRSEFRTVWERYDWLGQSDGTGGGASNSDSHELGSTQCSTAECE